MELRDYQTECVEAHFKYFASHRDGGNPLFVLPTGSGKSVVQAEFLRRVFLAWPDSRVLLLTHVKELIRQNHERLLALWPESPTGIYSAGLKSRVHKNRITFASIQSIYRIADRITPPELILVDECHLISRKGGSMYRTLIQTLSEKNPRLRIIGYTATPYRLDGGYLHEGEDALFTDVAFDLPVKKLIVLGYLSKLVTKRVEHVIDTAGVATRGGDFVASELDAAAVENLDVVNAAVTEAVEVCRRENRKHWLIFACGIAHANLVLGKLLDLGIEARAIFGETHHDEREETIDLAKSGQLTALVNVGVLTTGFDWPACDAIWFMRPTQSTGLYVQILGRGMRIAEGKQNTIVLDYGRNIERHGPIDMVTPQVRGGGAPPLKVCPSCDSYVAAAAKTCPDCGYAFPIPEREKPVARHDGEASTLDAISTGEKPKPEWIDVEDMTAQVWKKQGSPDSVRVDYWCGLRRVSEWICPGHEGFARKKFVQWWDKHHGEKPVPDWAEEAVARIQECDRPSAILVGKDGKYDRVFDFEVYVPGPPIPEDELPF